MITFNISKAKLMDTSSCPECKQEFSEQLGPIAAISNSDSVYKIDDAIASEGEDKFIKQNRLY